MKRLILFTAISLSALEPIDYNYGMVGLNTVLLSTSSADLGVGHRKIGLHLAWDTVIGCDLNKHSQLIYFQNSCLYYPNRTSGIYSGLGLTLGVSNFNYPLFSTGRSRKSERSPYLNIPVTIGYQYEAKSAKNRFVQLQVTPLYTATLSYGFEF